MKTIDYIKVAAVSPKLALGDIDFNVNTTLEFIKTAKQNNVNIICFPELNLTGYTCQDLFLQSNLLTKVENVLCYMASVMEPNIIAIVGAPIQLESQLFNCAVVMMKNKILGIIPKTFIPNYKEFYEKRWFTSGNLKNKLITLVGENMEYYDNIPFGNIVFRCGETAFGVEICEDAWAPIPPSSFLTLNGADIIFNLSASNELIGKADYRRELVKQQSARNIGAYVYVSAGLGESTSDIVFGGHTIIAENGSIIGEITPLATELETSIITRDIDVNKLKNEKICNKTFADSINLINPNIEVKIVNCPIDTIKNFAQLNRIINPYPFVPSDDIQWEKRCSEIFKIQVSALIRRLTHTNTKNVTIGVSGGLDSTLALLVTVEAFDRLGLDKHGIHGITMPGFGTTNQTYNLAIKLMTELGISLKEIPIKEACIQHFSDIGQDMSIHDITYENCQARERTQILMDYANKVNGFVIGTGDLSELALGWCTYNGDHMSMYSVNCSIPKTLVRTLVKWIAKNKVNVEATKVLTEILELPISPELLPPDERGNILQKTEDKIGPYVLHDFFLYNMLRNGFSPTKIYNLAKLAFNDGFSNDEIKKWLKTFYWKFFTQQFKRNCVPDGPKVGSVSLSPRGDWRMPSDMIANLWLKEIDSIE